jgi:drug/metabolite transporter (DMT)-like permease
VPVYLIAGLTSLAISLPLAGLAFPTENVLREILLVLGLGIVPTVIGHSILNHAMRHLRGQVVGIANLSQFIFAGIMAAVIFGEAPTWALYAAAALVAGGAILSLRQAPARGKEPPDPVEV